MRVSNHPLHVEGVGVKKLLILLAVLLLLCTHSWGVCAIDPQYGQNECRMEYSMDAYCNVGDWDWTCPNSQFVCRQNGQVVCSGNSCVSFSNPPSSSIQCNSQGTCWYYQMGGPCGCSRPYVTVVGFTRVAVYRCDTRAEADVNAVVVCFIEEDVIIRSNCVLCCMCM